MLKKILAVAFPVFYVMLSAMIFPSSAQEKKIFVQAHRGASGYAPENTMASFKMALEMKADYLELDVHLTKDGHLVIMHDETVDRTTDGKGAIKDMTLAEIKKLDAGIKYDKKFKGEKVPALEELLKTFAGKVKFNIEIKADECEEGVVKFIKKYKIEKDAMVSSFHHEYLQKVKELEPSIVTAGLVMMGPKIKHLKNTIKADYLNIHESFLTNAVYDKARAAGLGVVVWTVNEKDSMNKFVQMGVDGIITNFPDTALHAVNASSSTCGASENTCGGNP